MANRYRVLGRGEESQESHRRARKDE